MLRPWTILISLVNFAVKRSNIGWFFFLCGFSQKIDISIKNILENFSKEYVVYENVS